MRIVREAAQLAERYGDGRVNPRIFVYAAGGYYYPGKGLSMLRGEMRGYLDPEVGANLRFREEAERRVRRRSSGSLAGLPPGGQS